MGPPSTTSLKNPAAGTVTAVARYDFDGFGGQLSFRRGDEILVLGSRGAGPPSTASTPAPCPFGAARASSSSWCVGKRVLDGAKGIVYLPALRFPSTAAAAAAPSPSLSGCSATSSSSSAGGRDGHLFSWRDGPDGVEKGKEVEWHSMMTKEKEEEDGSTKSDTNKADAIELAAVSQRSAKRKQACGPQIAGFVIVLLVILFILSQWKKAGWEIALMGFIPRLLAFLDRIIHRRFL